MPEATATEQRSLIAASERALVAAEGVLRTARARVGERIAPGGSIDGAALDSEQIAAHAARSGRLSLWSHLGTIWRSSLAGSRWRKARLRVPRISASPRTSSGRC